MAAADDRLADLRRGGSPPAEAFEDAFARLFPLAYRVAHRIVGERDEAADLAADTVAKAWARWRRIDGYADAWVAKVAANAALTAVQRRGRRRAHAEQAPAPAGEPLSRADLVAALRHLPRRQREVVVLRYLADLSEADVAGALGCSVGAVKQHAHRGLAALRHDPALAEDGGR